MISVDIKEDAGVIKLYESFLTPCLYVAPTRNLQGRVPLILLFLEGNSTPTIPHKFSKLRIQRSRVAALTLQSQTDGTTAVSMRLTHGCGSSDAASPGSEA